MKPQIIKVSYDTPEDEALLRWAARNVDPEAKRRNDFTHGRNQDHPWPTPFESVRAFLTGIRDWWKS